MVSIRAWRRGDFGVHHRGGVYEGVRWTAAQRARAIRVPVTSGYSVVKDAVPLRVDER